VERVMERRAAKFRCNQCSGGDSPCYLCRSWHEYWTHASAWRRALFAAVRDVTGRVLLVRRCATGDWELPGGHVDPGESASDAAVREAAEESGITVEVTGLAGLYTDPGHVIARPARRTGAPAVRGMLPRPPAERQPER
jgi:8-oxo-dGTP pyrophosphatase MutT (NUDIX family)